MRKLFFVILAGLLVAGLCGNVWADATATTTTNAKSTNVDYATQTVAVTDQTNGYTLRVDSAGAASVMEYPKTIATALGQDIWAGYALVSEACRVSNIIVSGDETTAGDYILLYDAASATGTAKFDITLGTAKETVVITIPGGAIFSTGVFVKAGAASSSEAVVTITYDN